MYSIVEYDGAVLSAQVQDRGAIFLHLDAGDCKWTHTTLKKWRVIWDDVLEKMKAEGVEEVFSAIPFDCKIAKFQKMFGMKYIFDTADASIYRREL